MLSHSSLLETIATKGSNLPEHSATQQEVQELSEQYAAIKDKAKVRLGLRNKLRMKSRVCGGVKRVLAAFQAAVRKAEDLVLVHQEYQRGLHMFEDWLEQEQSNLGLLSPLDGDVNTLEKTLKELHVSVVVEQRERLLSLYFFCLINVLFFFFSRCSSHVAPKATPC